MALVQGLCSSFKQESWLGIHDLATDTIKIALYTASATLGPSTTAYTATDEVTGVGYLPGGIALTGGQVLLSGTTAYATFNNPTFTTVAFTCRGALLYNSSKNNRAVAVLDFGNDKTANGTFTIQMPAATASSAIIRFA